MLLMKIDSNEQATNPKFVSRMKRCFPELQIESLEFGDINVVLDNGKLLSIERKNVDDFLGSVADGRVFRQVEDMANKAHFYAIVMVGEMGFDEDDMVFTSHRETQWNGKAIRSAMWALQWSGCPIVWTNDESVPYMIMELIEFCEKPIKHYQKLDHKRFVTFPPLDERVQMLARFVPQIGIKRAESLLKFVKENSDNHSEDVYGTIASALAWVSAFPLIKESARPEGWGSKIVQTFRLAIGLDADEYIDIITQERKTK